MTATIHTVSSSSPQFGHSQANGSIGVMGHLMEHIPDKFTVKGMSGKGMKKSAYIELAIAVLGGLVAWRNKAASSALLRFMPQVAKVLTPSKLRLIGTIAAGVGALHATVHYAGGKLKQHNPSAFDALLHGGEKALSIAQVVTGGH
jgi:hypothetical protein